MSEQLASEQFAIGEVAIYWRPGVTGHGMEVTIASTPTMRTGPDRITGVVEAQIRYRVREHSPDGKWMWNISARYLRKKRPPAEDRKVVRWDECPWQPESINV